VGRRFVLLVVVLAGALPAGGVAGPAARNGALAVASNFAGARAKRTGIYLFGSNGSSQKQLTANRSDTEPAWSPTAKTLAFARFLPSGITQVWVMRGDGSGRHRLARRAGAWPTWSPNGKRIAFVSARANLWTMGVNGRAARRVLGPSVEGDAPAWSPRGDRIAFVRGSQIYLVSPTGHKLRALTSGRAGDFGPAWSPDGKRIAFVRTGASSTSGALWVIDVASRHVRRVGMSPGLTIAPLSRPAWSPDGGSIAIAGSTGGRPGVYVVPNGGGAPKLVAAHMIDPSWQSLR
jgi:Tol biopolymer transport system component